MGSHAPSSAWLSARSHGLVSRGEVRELPVVARRRRCKGAECHTILFSFVAHGESAVAEQSRDRPLDSQRYVRADHSSIRKRDGRCAGRDAARRARRQANCSAGKYAVSAPISPGRRLSQPGRTTGDRLRYAPADLAWFPLLLRLRETACPPADAQQRNPVRGTSRPGPESGSRGVPVRVGRGPGCFPTRCARHVRPRRARRRRSPPHASLPVSARAFALCAAPSSTRARDRAADRTGAVRRGRAGRRCLSTEAAGPAVGGVSRGRGGGSGSRAAGPWPGRGRATAAATRRGRPP